MRELRPELQALINSGHCNWHSTVDLVLTDGNQLHLSTGEIAVNRFGKVEQYLSRLDRNGVQEFSMSLDIEIDSVDFKISNVDLIIGRLLTSSVRRLDGAEGILGILFLEKGQPISQAIWDAKMPGQLIAGEVRDEAVDCSLVSVIDSITISGRTIASEFQWQEPISNAPNVNPDFTPTNPRDPFGPGETPRSGRGRYGDFDPMIPFYMA